MGDGFAPIAGDPLIEIEAQLHRGTVLRQRYAVFLKLLIAQIFRQGRIPQIHRGSVAIRTGDGEETRWRLSDQKASS